MEPVSLVQLPLQAQQEQEYLMVSPLFPAAGPAPRCVSHKLCKCLTLLNLNDPHSFTL